MKRPDYAEQHIQRLEVLEKSGLYEVGALQAISRKLSSYEHKLQSKRGGVEVILTYAAYAQTLELLHNDRKGKHCLGATKFNPFTGLVLSVYNRGVVRFHDNLELWMRFLSYSSSKGARKLVSRALVKALRFNPGCSGLWAYAASWEFNTQLNPFGARALIHRGLRACTSIQGLWREYFELELKYTEIIRNRSNVLDVGHIREIEPFRTECSKSKVTAQCEDGISSLNAHDGALAAGVYRAAKKQSGASLSFLLYFLGRVSKVKWAGRLQKLIYDDIMKDYPASAHELDVIVAFGKADQLTNVLFKHSKVLDLIWKYLTHVPARVASACLYGNCFSSLQQLGAMNMFIAHSVSNNTGDIIGLCNNFQQHLLRSERSKCLKLDDDKNADVSECASCGIFPGCCSRFVKVESVWLRRKIKFDVRQVFVITNSAK